MKTNTRFILTFLGAIAVLMAAILALFLYTDTQGLENTIITPAQAQESPVDVDFCSLSVIECSGEQPRPTANVGRTATVTAYSQYDSCHTGTSCLMASGKRAYVGAVACPRDIPLGSRVLIQSTEYTCEDRTASWVDGRYDIFMGYGKEAHDQAIQFGKQHLEVTIL